MSTERAPRFPNPHVAPRLVLYPLTGGGVALDWRLDPGLVAQARAAFVGPPPVAKLYLRRVDGASLAAAILPADPAHRPTGQARFEEPVVGSLRAELGLEDPCGSAWLLLARSNRLEAVPDSSGLATKLGARQPETRVAAEQVRLDPQPPNRQDVAPSESHAARGSGPLSPYPSADEAMIQGELHVFGRAAPGSLLDLGGHPLRVGPGGRFSFRVALDDPELLAALLARLPRLPVAERESPSFQASD